MDLVITTVIASYFLFNKSAQQCTTRAAAQPLFMGSSTLMHSSRAIPSATLLIQVWSQRTAPSPNLHDLYACYWLQIYTALTCASRKTHLHPPQVRCRDEVRQGAGRLSPRSATCRFPLKVMISQAVGWHIGAKYNQRMVSKNLCEGKTL